MITHYRAEEINKEAVGPKLTAKAKPVHYEVLSTSEARMQKGSKYADLFSDAKPASIQDIINCLKAILASAKNGINPQDDKVISTI